MRTFRFLDFGVYLSSKSLYRSIIQLTRNFPKEFFALADQIRRSSLSVILNIAEGSAKKSDKDFHRYLENALGSINETVAALDVAHDNQLLDTDHFNALMANAESIAKQLGRFAKKLSSDK